MIHFLKNLLSKPQQTEPPVSLKLLHNALQTHGIECRINGQEIRLDDGIRLSPQHLETTTYPSGNVRTFSSVTAFHYVLFSNGLLEYQHSNGSDEATSLVNGFENWVQVDLVALRDAVRENPINCTYMEKSFPDSEGSAPFTRQVLFGPTAQYPAPTNEEEDDHAFCPCCLFTNSMPAFDMHFRSKGLFGVRLFAARNADGSFAADCRINGEDFPEAIPHLITYAQTWPGTGLEFRKQYVVLRNRP